MSEPIYPFDDRDVVNAKLERLRDEFAMAAMTGMLAHQQSLQVKDVDVCYEMADEALRVREIKS